MTTTLTSYEPCDECEAPLAPEQRYCIVCGHNRRHPDDPVARYISNLRRPAAASEPVVAVPPRRSDNRVVVAALALLPVAAAAGVLVAGRNDGADPNLVAALKAQQAALAKAGPATAATPVANVEALASDFSRTKGFVVELQTLPFDTTDQAAADKAKSDAEGKGAKAVGIINPDDFSLKPASGGDYVLYSGEFKTKAEATKALAKLRKDFADAKVVAVKPASVSPDGESLKGTVDANTHYQAHPTKQQEDQGAQVVQDIQSKQGKDYVDQQQQLPDTIVVP
jgi:hypothetical protein